jgi:small-conductance mechanosensitive channel
MLVWVVVTLGAIAVALAAQFVVFGVVLRAVRKRPLATHATQRLRGPTRVLVAALVVGSAMASSPLSAPARSRIERAVGMMVIVGIAWLLTRTVGVLISETTRRLRVDVPDNLRARTMQTQLTILQRIVTALIAVLAIASILFSFGEVRALGASLLASAGIAGIVAGIAARSTLANVFAGVQIAFSAPIRIDDVVVVDGEWGRVEEITLSHVIVRTWDERRLILPCLYFLEHPFENWTRPTSEILAPLELKLDPCVDLEGLRREVDVVATGHPFWDRRVNVVQVTGSDATTVTVRVLLSARNSSEAFDLRCDVREALLVYLRRQQPDALPRIRLATGTSPTS